MREPAKQSATQPPLRRSAVLRVLANASLLAFASLCVISLATGRWAAVLLWGGALLVFFAPALDGRAAGASRLVDALARSADLLRWCGLALAAAGAALLLT